MTAGARVRHDVASVNELFGALRVDPTRMPRTRPFYQRLVDLVEKGLTQGRLDDGFQLPPERDLRARCGSAAPPS